MRALLLGVALATAGCRTIETNVVPSQTNASVRYGKRSRVWEVRGEDELMGHVVLFQEAGKARDSLYVVRNPWHQDLGLIDGLGRAYLYLPHREEPTWVGTGTILAGTQRILDLSAPCELVELSDLVTPQEFEVIPPQALTPPTGVVKTAPGTSDAPPTLSVD